jgi:hypothetical protein
MQRVPVTGYKRLKLMSRLHEWNRFSKVKLVEHAAYLSGKGFNRFRDEQVTWVEQVKVEKLRRLHECDRLRLRVEQVTWVEQVKVKSWAGYMSGTG